MSLFTPRMSDKKQKEMKRKLSDGGRSNKIDKSFDFREKESPKDNYKTYGYIYKKGSLYDHFNIFNFENHISSMCIYFLNFFFVVFVFQKKLVRRLFFYFFVFIISEINQAIISMDEIYCKMDTFKILDYSINSNNCSNLSFRLNRYVNFDVVIHVPEAANVIIDSSHLVVNTLPLSSMILVGIVTGLVN